MKTTILIFGVMLGLSHAQFGFGGFSATQNCAGGSNCNQNNFGRKRRQILEEILLEVEKEELSRIERDAVDVAQNCADSNCIQNNANLASKAPVPIPDPAPIPAPIPVGIPVPQPVPFEISVPQPVPLEIPVPQPVPVEIPVPQPVPLEIPVPQPVPLEIPGPQPVPLEIPVPQPVPMPAPVAAFPAGFPFSGGFPLGAVSAGAGVVATQNCVGSNCSQNNIGRRKREISEMIDSLTQEVLEAEAAEEAREREARARKKREAIERILEELEL